MQSVTSCAVSVRVKNTFLFPTSANKTLTLGTDVYGRGYYRIKIEFPDFTIASFGSLGPFELLPKNVFGIDPGSQLPKDIFVFCPQSKVRRPTRVEGQSSNRCQFTKLVLIPLVMMVGYRSLLSRAAVPLEFVIKDEMKMEGKRQFWILGTRDIDIWWKSSVEHLGRVCSYVKKMCNVQLVCILCGFVESGKQLVKPWLRLSLYITDCKAEWNTHATKNPCPAM